MSENRPIAKLMTRDDHFFLESNASLVPGMNRNQARAEYKRQFLAGMDAEENEIKKENSGRQQANEWLRTQRDGGARGTV